jgi:hypothetical protein
MINVEGQDISSEKSMLETFRTKLEAEDVINRQLHSKLSQIE